MNRNNFLAVGAILSLAGIIMFLYFNPIFNTLSKRFWGYDSPPLIEHTDFEYWNLLNTTVMPMINLLSAIGVTLLLLGALAEEKK